ncbi:hypothetical protein Hanom_Chr14g01316601 [Helianthus anomalus]
MIIYDIFRSVVIFMRLIFYHLYVTGMTTYYHYTVQCRLKVKVRKLHLLISNYVMMSKKVFVNREL